MPAKEMLDEKQASISRDRDRIYRMLDYAFDFGITTNVRNISFLGESIA